MRIGIVCYPTVGGSGVVATEMAIALAARGHEIHLLSYDRPSRLREDTPGLRFHEVAVSAYPLFRFPPYDLALATRMLEVHEEAGVDLFHVHYAIPHAVSAFLARSMCGGPMAYVRLSQSTSTSLNLGVSPARTTLSEVAIISAQSPEMYACGSLAARKSASPGCRCT